MGFVVTRTTLLATDVNFNELIQKVKWSARNRPPSIPMRSCVLVKLEKRTPLSFATISRIIDEITSLYVAIMREGTSSQNFMKIAAKEMAMIPTERPAMVLNNDLPLPEMARSIRELPCGVKRKTGLKKSVSDQ